MEKVKVKEFTTNVSKFVSLAQDGTSFIVVNGLRNIFKVVSVNTRVKKVLKLIESGNKEIRGGRAVKARSIDEALKIYARKAKH